MTLVIENVKDEFLPAFRGIAKVAKAKIKTKRESIDEWDKEYNQLMEDYKAGKVKGFDSIEELRKDLES